MTKREFLEMGREMVNRLMKDATSPGLHRTYREVCGDTARLLVTACVNIESLSMDETEVNEKGEDK